MKAQTINTLKGLDIYHGDTPLDFHAMAAAGVAFVFIKASQGTGYVDPHFRDNYQRAKSVGLIAGAYHFFDPAADPVEQAHHFLASAPLGKGDLVYALDVETDGQYVGARAYACAHEIKRLTGRWPILYSGDSFYRERLSACFPADMHTLWIARYGHPPQTPCAFWQYTDAGRLPGNRPLDTDTFYGSLDALKAHCL